MWQVKVLHEDDEVVIRRQIAQLGECQSGRLGLHKSIGIQFVDQGAFAVYNSIGEYWGTRREGERVMGPDWEYHRSKGKLAPAIAVENNSVWYCCLHPTLEKYYDGNVYPAGEYVLHPEIGSFVFLARKSVVNEEEHEKHTLLKITEDIELRVNSSGTFTVFK